MVGRGQCVPEQRGAAAWAGSSHQRRQQVASAMADPLGPRAPCARMHQQPARVVEATTTNHGRAPRRPSTPSGAPRGAHLLQSPSRSLSSCLRRHSNGPTAPKATPTALDVSCSATCGQCSGEGASGTLGWRGHGVWHPGGRVADGRQPCARTVNEAHMPVGRLVCGLPVSDPHRPSGCPRPPPTLPPRTMPPLAARLPSMIHLQLQRLCTPLVRPPPQPPPPPHPGGAPGARTASARRRRRTPRTRGPAASPWSAAAPAQPARHGTPLGINKDPRSRKRDEGFGRAAGQGTIASHAAAKRGVTGWPAHGMAGSDTGRCNTGHWMAGMQPAAWYPLVPAQQRQAAHKAPFPPRLTSHVGVVLVVLQALQHGRVARPHVAAQQLLVRGAGRGQAPAEPHVLALLDQALHQRGGAAAPQRCLGGHGRGHEPLLVREEVGHGGPEVLHQAQLRHARPPPTWVITQCTASARYRRQGCGSHRATQGTCALWCGPYARHLVYMRPTWPMAWEAERHALSCSRRGRPPLPSSSPRSPAVQVALCSALPLKVGVQGEVLGGGGLPQRDGRAAQRLQLALEVLQASTWPGQREATRTRTPGGPAPKRLGRTGTETARKQGKGMNLPVHRMLYQASSGSRGKWLTGAGALPQLAHLTWHDSPQHARAIRHVGAARGNVACARAQQRRVVPRVGRPPDEQLAHLHA